PARGAGAGPADAQGGDKDQVIDGLLQIIGHPDAANGSRLPETNRAIEALAALGRAVVPKLLDTILGPNGIAAAYAGHALNGIPAAEARGPVKERWDRLGAADRWKLAPSFARLAFDAVAQFALDSLRHEDEGVRGKAWSFVLQHRRAPALAPARERYLRVLAGEESPRLRWGLLDPAPVLDGAEDAH